MPRQNRVTPFGEIVAIPERGTLMGNRGVLHDDAGTIRRDWKLKRWILCLTEFKGRHRTILTPNRWTELFFLDEATGLAAGHRPCAECQRPRFRAYQSAWTRAHTFATASEIDDRLHAERLGPTRTRRWFTALLDELPSGVFVTLEDHSDTALLVWNEELLTWSPGGYLDRRPRPKGLRVRVLTPRSTVAAIRHGYTPHVHQSFRCEKTG